ncbi:MAG: hypothetical protein ABH862_02800 [Candidatus Omnitrophota bacterium]
MKKITLLVAETEKENFVFELRKAGIVHIRRKKAPSSSEITFIDDKQTKAGNIINLLLPFQDKKEGMKKGNMPEQKVRELIEKVEDILEKRVESEREKEMIGEKLEWFDIWSAFDPEDLKEIREKGVTLKLYKMQKAEYKKIKDNTEHIIAAKKNGYFYIAALVRETEKMSSFKEIPVPEGAPSTLKKRYQELEENITETDTVLKGSAKYIGSIKTYVEKLAKEKEFLTVQKGMQEEGSFSCLEGFCPEKKINKVIALAKEREAGYLIEEPNEPDETPTLITNPKWIRIIDPVFNFMNTLPGYKEFDISPYFLAFFSIFFAMLIGDAGYGILFLIITFLVKKKFKNIPREPFFLMYLLSVATIIWGAVTGTWFGAEQVARLPFFNAMVIKKISSFGEGNQNFIIQICFVIGAVHLTIAHILRMARVINSPKALAETGWIMVLWGMFFAAGRFVLNNPFPYAAMWMLLTGIFLVLVCSNTEKGFIKGALSTLADLPLSVISSFSDIVSYLRLFAVGYASVVVAESFNNMALQGGMNGVISTMGSVLILFFGHCLNIILGCMAVVVHGMRLNMLEFSGHLGMQWSGKKYEPFR